MSTENWIALVLQIAAYALSIGVFWGSVKARLKTLETKMDKHNNLHDRMIAAEKDIATNTRDIQENCTDIRTIYQRLDKAR